MYICPGHRHLAVADFGRGLLGLQQYLLPLQLKPATWLFTGWATHVQLVSKLHHASV
jgi:hypothetical protein